MGKSLSGRNLSQYRVMHDLSHYLYEVADAVIEAGEGIARGERAAVMP
jgi:hypothetical protein